MKKTNKGRKVALVAGLALVVLSVAMVSTYWEEIQSWYCSASRDRERPSSVGDALIGFRPAWSSP